MFHIFHIVYVKKIQKNYVKKIHGFLMLQKIALIFCDYFPNSLILRILLFYRFSRKKISENIEKKGKKSGFVKEKKSGRILLFSSFYNFTDSVNFEDLKKFFDFLIFFLHIFDILYML